MELNETLLRAIVEQVLRENDCKGIETYKQIHASGVILVKTAQVSCQNFGGHPGVSLQDVTTLTEAPRMGAGVMEVEKTTFPWTLTYDEYDVVLEGTLEIVVDGQVLTGHPGDLFYIPKGTAIQFRSPNKARYVYVVYPADWQ